MSTPRVSVLFPVYNDERFVSRAIQSILVQTFADFELIVVDDGSTDGTVKILEAFADPRIRIVFDSHQGVSAALNRAISLAGGEYLARMDSDDTSRPDRLERQSDFLDQHPDYGMVGSACEIVTEDGSRVGSFPVPQLDAEVRAAMIWGNPIVHSSVMIRKSVLDEVGFYDPNYMWEDYELWWRIISRYKVANLPDQLVARTNREASVSRVNKSRYYYENLRVQVKAAKYPGVPVSIYTSLAKSTCAYLLYRVLELDLRQ